jgi:CheY-like chemotaxis protein
MNGVELTSHIRAQSTTAKLPVIMITSRTASKHRQQAEAAGVTSI